MATPKEVIRELAADFKKRDLNYNDVAEFTGYSKQTIANIVSSQKKYFCEKQALRFSKAFGYNTEYLMTGKGRLLRNEYYEDPSGEGAASGDSGKISGILGILCRYAAICDDPVFKVVYDNLLKFCNERPEARAYSYLGQLEQLLDKVSDEKNAK